MRNNIAYFDKVSFPISHEECKCLKESRSMYEHLFLAVILCGFMSIIELCS